MTLLFCSRTADSTPPTSVSGTYSVPFETAIGRSQSAFDILLIPSPFGTALFTSLTYSLAGSPYSPWNCTILLHGCLSSSSITIANALTVSHSRWDVCFVWSRLFMELWETLALPPGMKVTVAKLEVIWRRMGWWKMGWFEVTWYTRYTVYLVYLVYLVYGIYTVIISLTRGRFAVPKKLFSKHTMYIIHGILPIELSIDRIPPPPSTSLCSISSLPFAKSVKRQCGLVQNLLDASGAQQNRPIHYTSPPSSYLRSFR